jgi:hypothetical protein
MRLAVMCALVCAIGCAGEGGGGGATTTLPSTTTTLVGAPTLDDIQADVFTPTCATGGCHDDVTRAGTLRLTTAEDSYDELVDVVSTCASRIRVVPGDPDASYLLHKLGDGPAPCGTVMPINAPALSAAELQDIRDWIAAGAAPPAGSALRAEGSTTSSSTTSTTPGE